MRKDGIDLGDLVRDTITGFKGIVIARTEWIAGCDRLTVQPQGLHDGKPYAPESFDITHVELVKAGVIESHSEPKPEKRLTGGPRPTPSRGR